MKFWLDVIAYQVVWFSAVLGAGRGLSWPGVVAATAFVAWRFASARTPRRDLRLMLAAGALGILFDGLWAHLRLIRYFPAAPALPPGGAPLWILALWVSFGPALEATLGRFVTRPLVAVLIGGIGGPLAYASAARLAGVVEFTAPTWRAWLALAIGWAAAVVALGLLIRRDRLPRESH